jgi:hypothetical protein
MTTNTKINSTSPFISAAKEVIEETPEFEKADLEDYFLHLFGGKLEETANECGYQNDVLKFTEDIWDQVVSKIAAENAHKAKK